MASPAGRELYAAGVVGAAGKERNPEMGFELKVDLTQTGMKEEETAQLVREALALYHEFRTGRRAFTGWVGLPERQGREELDAILTAGEKIRTSCSILIVIGIGGSCLGACAAIAALQEKGAGGPEVIFAGNSLSGTYHAGILRRLMREETCLCVISKSGETTETRAAFSIFQDAMIRKYGMQEAKKRIFVVTDQKKGALRGEAEKMGYETFAVPEDVSGRYSVLTPVGLLPIAAAGIDIEALLAGAAGEARRIHAEAERLSALSSAAGLGNRELEVTGVFAYAAQRQILFQKGKLLEIFEYYEPQLQYFAEWLKQLFGESEGKNGGGIFPVSLSFCADLHSMGQFLQEGNPIFFETVLHVRQPDEDLSLPDTAGAGLASRSLNELNRAAHDGVIAAHRKEGLPIVTVEIDRLLPEEFGAMVYFFEMACALSAALSGADPFNQPGVESYKTEMWKMLAEPSKSE